MNNAKVVLFPPPAATLRCGGNKTKKLHYYHCRLCRCMGLNIKGLSKACI
jgi:hypothetical protein